MRQIRKYINSGEMFACDPDAGVRTAYLHHTELGADWDDYQMDYDMDPEDSTDTVCVRYEES